MRGTDDPNRFFHVQRNCRKTRSLCQRNEFYTCRIYARDGISFRSKLGLPNYRFLRSEFSFWNATRFNVFNRRIAQNEIGVILDWVPSHFPEMPMVYIILMEVFSTNTKTQEKDFTQIEIPYFQLRKKRSKIFPDF